MMDSVKRAGAALVLTFGIVLTPLVTPAIAASQEALLPLQSTDFAAGCGCNFVRYKSKGENPILHWTSDGKKQAVVRSGGKLHVLDLRQEKYIPLRTDHPQPDDRMVLFVANGDWQIQVLGTAVGSACKAKKQCTQTDYQGRLLVQQDGGARNEIPVEGTCDCPKQ
ncbi:MAG: hypothetical protein JWL63_944 [Rhodocyclales bacterium]|nr:hypothetical protein [Rhodocyclales bacterium]